MDVAPIPRSHLIDRIIDSQLTAEIEGNVEAILAHMTKDISFNVVGAWRVAAAGHEPVRRYYESWLAEVLPERNTPVRRLQGGAIAFDESIWEGRIIGRVGRLAGEGRRATHTVCRLVELRHDLIARETIFRDLDGIERHLSIEGPVLGRL